MPTTRRFKLIYLAITALFVLAAFGFAAAGIWVVALATFLMGGVMTVASRQMKVPPPPRAAGDSQGDDTPRDPS
ncbi:MAG: hypothetical protein Q7T55_08310 [Solirubrobacteraceae bacterium]|nr:hypothetical protein [Solirubrobacteraceae bacterium]